jgi:hypothetical protein
MIVSSGNEISRYGVTDLWLGVLPGGRRRANEARWLRRLAGYCWRFKRDVIISLTGAILYTVATLTIPLLQRDIIDNVIVAHKESVWPLAIGLLIAAAANFIGIFMRRYRGGKMALDVQHDHAHRAVRLALPARRGAARTRSTPGSSSAGPSPTSTWWPAAARDAADAGRHGPAVRQLDRHHALPLARCSPSSASRSAPALLAINILARGGGCSPRPGTRSRRRRRARRDRDESAAACAWSRASARRSRRWTSWTAQPARCSAPGCG